MARLEISRLKKSFGALDVIPDFSLSVGHREFVSLLGPSGCGKSTILRIVAGLESLTSGRIHIEDRDVTSLEPRHRDIAMVFQNYALYPHRTVYDNLAYALRIRGMSKADIAKRVDEVASMLQLTELLSRYPKQLSGGQQQRVAMGRAIVREPAAFLFDEPLSNLDAKLRNHMRVEIRQLQSRLGITTLYVTHDQVEAMTMSDKVVVLNKGGIEQMGGPLDIYERPASLFVAGFIGSPSMNLLPGKADGHQVGLGDGLVLNVQRDLGQREIVVGIRPERVKLTAAGAPGSLPFSIKIVEELGSGKVVHGAVGSFPVVLAHPEDSDLPSDGAGVLFPDKYLRFFDKASGKAI